MTDLFSLTGKTILVTGASSGIGKQAAILISQAGGTLCISGRNEYRFEETFHSLEGTGHRMKTADLTAEMQLNALVEEAPALNGVVHCAGIVGPQPVKFISQEHIDTMFAINFEAPVNLTGKLLRKKKILDNASVLFLLPSPRAIHTLAALCTALQRQRWKRTQKHWRLR